MRQSPKCLKAIKGYYVSPSTRRAWIEIIKATDVKGDDTEKYVEIYPQGRAKHGNDRKGDKSKVRYATIGFVAEYGTSSHAARPYMTVANEKAHEKVVEAQRSIWESETGE